MLDSSHNYNKRGCQLPPGCKDLIDVINLEKNQKPAEGMNPLFWKAQASIPQQKSPLQGTTVEIKSPIVVQELAQILGVKPFHVIADLLMLGVFANLNGVLNFDTAAKVLAKYGVVAKKIA